MQNEYSQDFVERVRNASDIIEIARNYLPLRQKGQDFWACCPFHSEKTPSFAISSPKQFYYCYGCHESGNVFKFVMKMENLSWPEAVAMLAKRANIEIPQTSENSGWLRARQKRERLYQALNMARDFYCRNLLRAENRSALDYLHQRGIDDELIKLFHIGYSDSWQGVVDELKQHGISEDIMHEAGIVARKDGSNRVWDAQFERITFAIHDVYGNCVGFTGRTTKKDDNIAKYKNTTETSIFNKSNIVYGVDVMKTLTRNKHTNGIIVVEGNVDEIAMIKHGFVNTVACMGTALTKFHAGVIRRFSQLVYLCLDGDNAGQNATLKSIDTLQDAGLTVKVIVLPGGQDPDEYLQKFGAEGMQKMIDQSIGGLEFKLEYIKKHSDLSDKIGKTDYLNQVVKLLSAVDSPAERELYIKDIANNLGVEKDVIRDTINLKIPKKENDAHKKNINTTYSGSYAHNKHKKSNGFNDGLNEAEQTVIKGLLHNQPYAVIETGEITFNNQFYQKIFEQNLKLNEIDDKLNQSELQEIAPLRVSDDSLSQQEQKVKWQESYLTLRIAYLERKLEKAIKSDIAMVTPLKKQIMELKEKRKLVKQDLEER